MSETQEVKTEIAQYAPIKQTVAELKALNDSLVFDYASKSGNKEARSHIHKLRGSRGQLERARKDAKAWVLAIGKDVDAQAEEIDSEIQAMIKVHLDPIEEIERIEKERTDKAFALLTKIVELPGTAEGKSSADILSLLEAAKAIVVTADEYHEFYQQAVDAKESGLNKLQAMAVAAAAHEAEQVRIAAERAELEVLRQQAAARASADREEQIRKEAAEAARIAAETAAAAEKDRIAAEALAAQEAAAAREAKLIADAAQAEADAKAAIARAEAEAEARIKAAADEAARVAAVAAAAEKEAEAIEAARQANREHRNVVHNEILSALTAEGIDIESARAVIRTIIAGKVPRITINY